MLPVMPHGSDEEEGDGGGGDDDDDDDDDDEDDGDGDAGAAAEDSTVSPASDRPSTSTWIAPCSACRCTRRCVWRARSAAAATQQSATRNVTGG